MIPIYWLPLFLMLAVLIYLALKHLRGARQLTIVEAKTFLRHAAGEEFLRDLNPQIEEAMRGNLSTRQFLDVQRDSLHRMKERLLCMSHDAMVFIQLANTEIWKETRENSDPDQVAKYVALGRDLHQAAVEFRFFSIMALVRIEFWLILRTKWWLPLRRPSIADLRLVGGIHFYPCYQRFRSAVGSLCLEYGQQFYDEIVPML